eukprot:9388094-Alexandrium_andersonii.AAC.1
MDLIEITRMGRGPYRPPTRTTGAPREAEPAAPDGAVTVHVAPGGGALALAAAGASGPAVPAGAAGASQAGERESHGPDAAVVA